MRLLEIDIYIYDLKEAEISGEETVAKTPSKACIDLDRVYSCWVNGKGEPIICLCNGESYVTSSYTYEQFVEKWQGTCKEEKRNCPSCNVGNLVQIGDKTTCTVCGYERPYNENSNI